MDIRKSIKMVMKYSNLSMAQGKSLQETNSTGKKKNFEEKNDKKMEEVSSSYAARVICLV